MDPFENSKIATLKNLESGFDKSRKGSVDEPIKNLLDAINKLDNYYTTSSCSGRIMITSSSIKGKKHENKWYFVSHEVISNEKIDELWKLINEIDDELWLRMDAAILHVACKTLKDAHLLLILAKKVGFKRGGIISVKRKVVELISTEHVEMPLKVDEKILTDFDGFKLIIEKCNEKLNRTHEKIQKFEEEVKKLKSSKQQ
ncbi:MAG: hypothetical protein QXS41_01065 [Candidatus Woesearchaeota archaeon]